MEWKKWVANCVFLPFGAKQTVHSGVLEFLCWIHLPVVTEIHTLKAERGNQNNKVVYWTAKQWAGTRYKAL